ncbi:MAG: hypothetical protein ACRDAR_13940, partial [Aeromonas veronii]
RSSRSSAPSRSASLVTPTNLSDGIPVWMTQPPVLPGAFVFVAAAVPDRTEWLDYRGVIPLFFNILAMSGY